MRFSPIIRLAKLSNLTTRGSHAIKPYCQCTCALASLVVSFALSQPSTPYCHRPKLQMPFSPSGPLGVEELHICGTATRNSSCDFDYVYDRNKVDSREKDEHHRVAMTCSFDYLGTSEKDGWHHLFVSYLILIKSSHGRLYGPLFGKGARRDLRF